MFLVGEGNVEKNTAKYRGSLPDTHFGTWKKTCYMKLVLVGLYTVDVYRYKTIEYI